MSAAALLFLAALPSGALRPTPPPLPRQSKVQAEVVARARAMSARTHASGLAELRAMLDSPATRQFLRELDDGSHLAEVPTDALLDAVRRELEVAELVHNFGEEKEGNCGKDVTLGSGEGAPYFYNQWELQVLGFVPVDAKNNPFPEFAETTYFGFPPFKNASKPDWTTSADRVVYGAVNMFRSSAGNPQCGPVAAVFARGAIKDDAVVAPMDTGMYVGECEHGQTGANTTYNCSAWQGAGGVLGVPSQMDALLVHWVKFFNATRAVAGEEYALLNLARVLTRLLSRETYRGAAAPSSPSPPVVSSRPVNLTFQESTLGYLEMNPAVTLALPSSVKMMIAAFDVWFGTENGEALQAWCQENGWPLAWAHVPLSSTLRCDPDPKVPCDWPPARYNYEGVSPANVRLLDPVVLEGVPAGHNVTGEDDFQHAKDLFLKTWKTVRSTVPEDVEPLKARRPLLDPVWQSPDFGGLLASSSLAVEPLFAGACANVDCVGVRLLDSACVC